MKGKLERDVNMGVNGEEPVLEELGPGPMGF